jgi:deoxyribodipyrimidine photo-lyase
MNHALEAIVPDYNKRRDTPHGTCTSRLGQDLRFGLLSPRELVRRTRELAEKSPSAAAGATVFLKELAWREFYMSVLWHWPEVLEKDFNQDFRLLEWDHDEDAFRRWQTGTTGFPIVDAGMRQLAATGYMHNRLRMITAMFLTKDIGMDWRLGEQFFLQHLVDGEIASNNGGWQWSAGTGADAAPYFRIQNPWSQSARHDPEGLYIKQWVPELAGVAPSTLHQPPPDGKPLARGYPLPMLDHATARDTTLRRFAKAKDLARNG